jgi:cytoskeletal protein CcmA (bactofilin family)
VGFETVLGANSTMEGTLKSSANIRLDGTFTGTLEVTGNVLVGETAKITADINARNVSVAGAVRGNISGKKIQLLRTGRVWGDIHATALTTEEGAFIDGKITMVSPESQTGREALMSENQPQQPDAAPPPEHPEHPEHQDTNARRRATQEHRIIEEIAPHGMGAVSEGPDEMQHHAGEPEIGNQGTLVDNISADNPEVFGAQTDSPEGQRNADREADDHSDETRQST